MAFQFFENENEANGLPKNSQFQVGISNFDPGTQPEKGIMLPSMTDPAASWVYYDIALACLLDSGIVTHNVLPTVDNTADTLAFCDISDPAIDVMTGRGVNLKSNDDYKDIVQRMAHSRYWFRLYGQAMRMGHQVPIPGMKSIGGVKAIPHDDNPQFAYNKIIGNYSGLVLWHAVWSLWYTVSEPPAKQQVPPANLAQHIAGDVKIPDGIQSPFSQPDNLAQKSQPSQLLRDPVRG